MDRLDSAYIATLEPLFRHNTMFNGVISTNRFPGSPGKCDSCGKLFVERAQYIPWLKKDVWMDAKECACLDKADALQMENERIEAFKKSGIPMLGRKMDYSTMKDEVDADKNINLQYSKIHNYIRNVNTNVTMGMSWFLYGTPGTGKTLAMSLAAEEVMKFGKSVKYMIASQIMDKKFNINDALYEAVFIIDELGMAKCEGYDGKLFTIINARIQGGKSTWIGTNAKETDLKDIFKDGMVDRINSFYTTCMVGPSHRTGKTSIKVAQRNFYEKENDEDEYTLGGKF